MKEYFDESQEVEYIPQSIHPNSSGITASRDEGRDALSDHQQPSSTYRTLHGTHPNKC